VSHIHFAFVALAALIPECNQAAPAEHADEHAAEHAAEHADDAGAAASAEHGKPAEGANKPAHGGGDVPARKFSVPFAWEASQDDALRTTKSFMQGFFTDNAAYVKAHNETFFKPFVQTQKPRATVITCADSRVHTAAFDARPENDVFLVRNIGNQVVNAEGSVEYGVHHLKTRVLVIMGHTGCGAIKARMGDISKESDAIRHELESLSVPKPKDKGDERQAWQEAVVANVNEQVAFSLLKFSSEVETGDLTVVGAVYDLKNDMKQGHGHIVLVNVNGNTDPVKLTAFEKVVMNKPDLLGRGDAADAKDGAPSLGDDKHDDKRDDKHDDRREGAGATGGSAAGHH